jgi:hypothetical protein
MRRPSPVAAWWSPPNLVHHGRQTVGSVVGSTKVLIPEKEILWTPVVSFEHAERLFQAKGHPRKNKLKIRERVTVFYDSGDVPGALIAGDEPTWASATGRSSADARCSRTSDRSTRAGAAPRHAFGAGHGNGYGGAG